MTEQDIAARVIERIVEASENIAFHAGVGGMETAGSIISYLAKHPDQIPALMDGTLSVLDWPDRWHTHGVLTWHGADGKLYSPEFVRRQMVIKGLAQPQAPAARVPDTTAIATIAASLVEVAPPAPSAIDDRAKDLVLALTGEWARLSTAMLPRRASPFVRPARKLKERGLVESRQEQGGVVFWRLTLIGLAVRQHLQGDQP